MELNLSPNEEIKLSALFEPLTELLPLAPLTLIINGIENGDLSLKKYDASGPSNSQPLYSGDRAEDFLINLYCLSTAKGCKAQYQVMQLGKNITK